MDAEVGLRDVEAAADRMGAEVRRTPLLPVEARPGLWVKLENLQRTGSFKLRGALNAVGSQDDDALRAGVSTMSAGNHGLGLATACRLRGVHCRVYVPETAVARKVAAMEAQGAEVVPVDHERLGRWLAAGDTDDGRLFISPFADRNVAAGQGTVGLEVAEDLPAARTVLVPIGGGGLALGVSTAVRALHPEAKVFGVTAAGSPAVRRAFRDGDYAMVKPTSIADGLGSPVAVPEVVAALQSRLHGMRVVDDDAIREAMRLLATETRTVAEPAGAAATAAALAEAFEPPVVAIVSGGNVDPALLADVLTARETTLPAT